MTGILQGLLASIGAAQIPFLYSWGNNGQGQLGTNNTISRSSPVQIDNEEWDKISLGSYMSALIKADGTLWTWGYARDGCLGQNDLVKRSSPTQVGALTNWANVSASAYYGCIAVKTDGSLWTWGNNDQGRLGLGDKNTKRSSPTQVGALLTWAKVAGGTLNAAAIKTDDTLWIWGNNGNGQLGQGTTGVGIDSPVQLSGSWSQVALGDNGNHGIKTNGAIFGWGFQGAGQLGTNSYTQFNSPVQITSTTDWAFISRNGYASGAAIKTNGTLWMWGANSAGTLGLGYTGNRSSPTQVGSDTWLTVSNGRAAGAIKTDGTLWMWGNGGDGQLGQGNTANRSSPVQVGSGAWSKIATGSASGSHALAIED